MNNAVALASTDMELRPCLCIQRRQLVIKYLEVEKWI